MRYPSRYKFCPHCSQPLDDFLDETFQRSRCPKCGWIHYRNPTAGVAVVVMRGRQLLLGQRRKGGFCIPCGHVEWDESVEDAARREFLEETGLHVELRGVLAVKSNFHNPDLQTIGIWYQGRQVGGQLSPGGDLLEVKYYDLDDVPRLAFPTDEEVIDTLRSRTD